MFVGKCCAAGTPKKICFCILIFSSVLYPYHGKFPPNCIIIFLWRTYFFLLPKLGLTLEGTGLFFDVYFGDMCLGNNSMN